MQTMYGRGVRELVDLGVLDVIGTSTAGQEGTRTFRRNVYSLRDDLRSVPTSLEPVAKAASDEPDDGIPANVKAFAREHGVAIRARGRTQN